MTTASACPACLGESHDNCSGTPAKPCACGCLCSAASLHKWTLHSLPTEKHAVVQRRINAMRLDGKQVD